MLFEIHMQRDHEHDPAPRPHPEARRWRDGRWPAHYVVVATLEDLMRIVEEVGGAVRIRHCGIGDPRIEVLEDRPADWTL